MAISGQESLEARPIDDARSATDTSLRAERKQTDQALEQKLSEPVEQTERTLQLVRGRADRQISHATQELSREAETPAASSEALQTVLEQQESRLAAAGEKAEGSQRAGQVQAVAVEALERTKEIAAAATEAEQSKARAVVEQLSHQAEKTLEEERRRVDTLTRREREERKQAFLEVLAEERRDTDQALHIERKSSDALLNTRDEVLSVISHDLRNLLNAISLKAETLRRALPEELTGPRKLTADIKASCDVMARWAGDLVDLSSMDAGILEIHLRSHDPTELIEQAAQAFAPLAECKGIRLKVQVPEHHPQVVCDSDRIMQVLTNLLDNAMKFTPPGGEISVRFEALAQGSGFCVHDTGPGIPEPEHARIFERRWHASKGTGGGTGLGLYISKRVIESHRGHLWVESQPGQGSSFCFTLPVLPPDEVSDEVSDDS